MLQESSALYLRPLVVESGVAILAYSVVPMVLPKLRLGVKLAFLVAWRLFRGGKLKV